jgi:glycosyltransferase involved in cell wall biosynthesis
VQNKINIIMHAFADKNNICAQDLNAREIAIRLDPNIFNVTMFYRTNPDNRVLKQDNIQLIKLSGSKIMDSLKILKELLCTQYDIFFYVRNFLVDYIYYLLRNLYKDNKETFYWIENCLPYPTSKLYNHIAKYNALKSKHIFSVSNYVATTAKCEYGITVPTQYVGVDLKKFILNEKTNINGRVKVLFIGSFQKRKRPFLVIEAARAFPQSDFYLIGNGPLKDDLINRKINYGTDNVFILPAMQQDKLIKYYQIADIFLFPSIHEGYPKVILEASACGLPCIVFNNYLPESVINNKTGFIVHDIKEMLSCLKQLIENTKLRQIMGRNASKYVNNFGWDVIAKNWEREFINAIES